MCAQFADKAHDLYHALIEERDRFMAARILIELNTHRYQHMLVVVGAGISRSAP